MQYVVALDVYIEPRFDRMEAEKLSVELKDPLTPSSVDVKTLFSTLGRLHSLSIGGTSRLASLVLSPEVSASSFPNMTELSLTSSFSSFQDPFHPVFYRNLGNYTSLGDFFLFVLRNHKNIRLSKKALPEDYPFADNISGVSLKGPLSSSPDSVKRLLSSFGCLAMVTLVDFSRSSQLYDLLGGLEFPQHIRYLSISKPRWKALPPTGSIFEAISKFTSLVLLGIGGSCSCLSPEFYSTLRILPVKKLAFEMETDVNLKELDKLITGSKKHRSLETIYFDNVQGKIGTSIEGMDDVPYTGEPYRDWELPEWTSNFTASALREFLKVAEREGIKVEGSAIKALRVNDLYMDEMEALRGYGQ
jgi:hypothetical protein